jgi:hypothetical protein
MGSKGDGKGDYYYRCSGRGHHAVECPTRVQRSALYCNDIVISEESKREISPGKEHDEEEDLEFSALPLCVIRRILTG